MAVSLEARVPFLDLELMRLVESLPPHLKIHGRTRKYVLKRALAKWVPTEVIRRKKIPFRPPIDQWLRTDLRSHVADLLLDRDSGCTKYFERKQVQRMIEDHADGRQDYKRALLSLLVFELWHGLFISASPGELRRALGGRAMAVKGAGE